MFYMGIKGQRRIKLNFQVRDDRGQMDDLTVTSRADVSSTTDLLVCPNKHSISLAAVQQFSFIHALMSSRQLPSFARAEMVSGLM